MKTKVEASVFLVMVGLRPVHKSKNKMSGRNSLPITDAQKRFMDNCGIGYALLNYRGQASEIITVLKDREKDGLATPRQIQVLYNNGYNTATLCRMTKGMASTLIDQLHG